MPLESPHADAVKAFFSPTGAHAVVVLADGSAEIRDSATGKAISPRIQLEAGVDVARFSPDGTRVVLAGDSLKEGEPNEPVPVAIQLWDTKSGRAIAEPARFDGSASEDTLSSVRTRVSSRSYCRRKNNESGTPKQAASYIRSRPTAVWSSPPTASVWS